MNLCLLGATGRVGSVILQNSVESGMSVKALVRDSSKPSLTDSAITYIQGDALNAQNVEDVIAGSDVVICALNTGGAKVLSTSMPLIIEAMKKYNVTRIITIGTAGILQSSSEPQLYRFQSRDSKRKSTIAAEDHLHAFLQLKESGLDWTIVCPTYLPQGDRIGEYRFEKDFLPAEGTSISVYDTADFAFKQVFSKEFIGSRVGLSY